MVRFILIDLSKQKILCHFITWQHINEFNDSCIIILFLVASTQRSYTHAKTHACTCYDARHLV